MEVWLLRISSMGGAKDFYETAYSDQKVAETKAEDLKEEWTSFHPEKFDGEEILDNRVIVENHVYNLDKKDNISDIKERALGKLSKKEKEILGLPDA